MPATAQSSPPKMMTEPQRRHLQAMDDGAVVRCTLRRGGTRWRWCVDHDRPEWEPHSATMNKLYTFGWVTMQRHPATHRPTGRIVITDLGRRALYLSSHGRLRLQ